MFVTLHGYHRNSVCDWCEFTWKFCVRHVIRGAKESGARSSGAGRWPLPWGSCHARREHVMNMYRQAVAAPCNLRLAGNYLRENGPGPVPAAPHRAPRSPSHRNESLIASKLRCRRQIAAHAPVANAVLAQTRRLAATTRTRNAAFTYLYAPLNV